MELGESCLQQLGAHGNSCIYVASSRGLDSTAHLLASLGADVHHANNEGNIGLLAADAASEGICTMIELFASFGACIQTPDARGLSPAYCSAQVDTSTPFSCW